MNHTFCKARLQGYGTFIYNKIGWCSSDFKLELSIFSEWARTQSSAYKPEHECGRS